MSATPTTGQDRPGMRPSEIAIEEYRALRPETLSHFTSTTTLVSIALTATAANRRLRVRVQTR